MGMPRIARSMGQFVLVMLLAACSNGRGSLEEQPPQAPQTPPPSAPAQDSYSIGGVVTGLTSSGLVLQNNGAGDLAISADGPFTFTTTVASGAAYDVRVATQPASQTCTVSSGAGAVSSANVTNIQVACSATPRFTVGGAVSGLIGAGLRLQNNGGDALNITADGPFAFATPLETESTYSVTVAAQPVGQNCTVQNPTGTIATANVADVQVSCATNQFTVGGSVSGLEGGGLVVRLNDGNDLRIVANGPFAFPTALVNGTSYVATVFANPTNPSQDCKLDNGTGVIAGGNVASITIACATRSFTVGGTVSGLAPLAPGGTGLSVQLNGTQPIQVAGNGSFTFSTPILSGTSYSVTVLANPTAPLQECTVSNGLGIVRDQNITSVAVTCATRTFAVGGTVSGLLGSGLRLRNSNGEVLAIAADGSFVFPTRVASGGAYTISVETPPATPTQSCSIANGTGTITNADVANIAVSCSTSNFTIGGNVANLLGSGLILRNNGGDDLTPTSSGPFTFATAIPSASAYSVTIGQQPTAPSQTCAVENGAGTVGAEAVTTVVVSCTTNGFLVGGTVTGLFGQGLQLQNGADILDIAADGPFRFPTAVTSGSGYSVVVVRSPSNPDQVCQVVNGAGTIQDADVASVEVRCTTLSRPTPF